MYFVDLNPISQIMFNSSQQINTHISQLLFFGWLFLGLSFSLSAQYKKTKVEQISTSDGLSNRTCHDMIQDANGFLWIATENGLNKYDGYTFTVYNNSPSNKNFIHGNYIMNIENIKGDYLAIQYRYNSTYLDILNPRTSEVKQLDLNHSTGIRGSFKEVFLEENGSIYILSSENDRMFLQVSKDGEAFTSLFNFSITGDQNSIPLSFIKSTANQFWINTSPKQLSVFDHSGKKIKAFDKSHFQNKTTESVSILHQDKSGKIWVAWESHPGLYFFDEDKNQFILYPDVPSDQYYHNIWEDESGNKIVGEINQYEAQHLYCIRSNDEVLNYTFLTNYENKIIHFFGDNFLGTFFMATYTGIKKIIQPEANIDYYLTQNIDPEKEEWGYAMRGIVAHNNKIYAAREVEHWYEIDPYSKEIQEIKLKNPTTGATLSIGCSFDLIIDQQNQLWGSSCDSNRMVSYLHQYDLKNKSSISYYSPFRVRHISNKKGEQKIWVLGGFEEDKKVDGQLATFDQATKKFTTYLNADGSNPLKDYMGQYIYTSSNNTLWVGTIQGLISIDLSNKTSKVITANDHTLKNVTVYVIQESKDGLLYLGTNKGLIILDPKTNKTKVYNHYQGLQNNSIAGIIPDKKGNLWLSTFYGLSYFDAQTESFRNFNNRDGLSHNEFNRFSFFKGSDDIFYFGGMNGINAFHPNELLQKKKNRSVQLTKLVYYESNKDTLIEKTNGLHLLKSLALSAYVSYFQFNFTLPNYEYPQNNQYKVWLEGFDKDWTFLGNNHSIRYNKLPAGNYTLHINGADSRGNWGEKAVLLKITVAQHFYDSKWFPFLIFLGLFLIGFLLYRKELSQIREMEDLRTRIASDLHDEVGSIMTRISMGSEMVNEGIYEPKEQKKELNYIANQSRQVTSIMRDVVWSIDARKDKVSDLIDRMREHLEELLPLANIQHKIIIEQINTDNKINVNLRQNIYFIFKEAINNIVKHSNATEVVVSLINHAHSFTLVVANNGTVDDSKEEQTSGQGLKNMQMRAKRINADLEIQKEKGYTIKVKTKGL